MPKKENKDKWYNNISLWVMIVFAVIIVIAFVINTDKPKPDLGIKINEAAIQKLPVKATTTILPDKLAFDKSVCEKSCITRTHYFSNGTRKLICVPLKDMGACEEVDD